MPIVDNVNATGRDNIKRKLVEMGVPASAVYNMDDSQLRVEYARKLSRKHKQNMKNITGANNAIGVRDFKAATDVMNQEGFGPKTFPVVKACITNVAGNHTVWRHNADYGSNLCKGLVKNGTCGKCKQGGIVPTCMYVSDASLFVRP